MRSLLCALVFLSLQPLQAFAFSQRPHLFFIEGSLGGAWNSAFDREDHLVNQYGPFYWMDSGNFYRYKPSDLTLTAGIGYEFLVLQWLGLRASYSYTSYIHNWQASNGSSRNRRSSWAGGQAAETDGYFIGPVFRYRLPWVPSLSLELPILWGRHVGEYYPLEAYTEFREKGGAMPVHADEHTRQRLEITKWRYGLGIAFLQEGFPLYLSLQLLMESGFTSTAVGPDFILPAGSAWDAFIGTLAVGWRL